MNETHASATSDSQGFAREYQHGFSLQHPEVFDVESRTRKANTALAVMREAFDTPLDRLRLLNVGASSGVMDQTFASACAEVVGIDIDEHAIAHAQRECQLPNLTFLVADALDIPFPDASFDIVVCSQIYEHVPDQPALFREIRRVLKVGGGCYFAATSRLIFMEPHYRLPLLSWLPPFLSDRYLRAAGRGDRYYERMHMLPKLRQLTSEFSVEDYTVRMLDDPERFGIDDMVARGSWKQKISRFVASRLPALCPGYIWILRKTH